MQLDFLTQLENIIKERKQNLPEGSYTTSLFKKGHDKILQKLGEEAVEYIIDAKNENSERAISEGADLIFHLLMSLAYQGLSLADIVAELEKRHKK